ncbi:MAG: response regulator [Proteobacteria bacterium]|nr:response regulator [Pseudomonadota bacterium]
MAESNKERILIIDDEELIRQSYSDFLIDMGYEILTAENGRIGLEVFQQEKVNLVLVDLRMPEVEGLEVLKSISQSSPDTPLIVSSGTGAISDVVEALRSGAWDYLLKPLSDFNVLIHAVANGLDKARLIRENLDYQKHLEIKVEERTSELQQVQQKILNLNKDLENTVTERTRELKDSLADLKKMQTQMIQNERVAALGNMVFGVAHEINTPLGIGITAITHLQDKSLECSKLFDDDNLSKKSLTNLFGLLQESSSIILSNLENIASLISNFKLVAVDQISENIRIFNVKEYLEDIFLSLKLKLMRTPYSIEIKGDSGLVIESYPGILSQIITNLVMNSLVHGFEEKPTGSISIEFSMMEGDLVLEYRDDGKGMSSIDLKQIFDPFFTTKRNIGGTGLGMHIVYNLINRNLSGSVTCESSPGNGIRFLISFPTVFQRIKG